MPFQNVKLSPSPLADALTPDAFFGANSLFDERTRQGGANDKKKLVAEFIAKNFTTIGGSALLTDGSSTFFVGLAIALQSQPKFNHLHPSVSRFHLATNNLALISEFNARQITPNITIEILAGDFDYSLCAVFPKTVAWKDDTTAGCVGCVIASARSLYFHSGPTSPDHRSANFKRTVMCIQVPLIFAVDDEKLSDPCWPFNAVMHQNEWDAIKAQGSRQICIVSNKPYGKGIEKFDTLQVGEEVAHDGLLNRSKWEEASKIQRYCYQAYSFAELSHVSFIEVERGIVG